MMFQCIVSLPRRLRRWGRAHLLIVANVQVIKQCVAARLLFAAVLQQQQSLNLLLCAIQQSLNLLYDQPQSHCFILQQTIAWAKYAAGVHLSAQLAPKRASYDLKNATSVFLHSWQSGVSDLHGTMKPYPTLYCCSYGCTEKHIIFFSEV